MDFLNQNILTLLTFWPMAGVVLILLFMKEKDSGLIKRFTVGWMVLQFIVSLVLWFSWDTAGAEITKSVVDAKGAELVPYNLVGKGFAFVQHLDWIDSLGVSYFVGTDGLTRLLILLTTMLGPLAALASFKYIGKRQKEFYIWLLVLQTGMVGVFCALDVFLFYIFWEVMLVPMYFLIGIWGGKDKLYAAIKFFLYTLAGSVLMLLAILFVYFKTADLSYMGGQATFNVFAMWDLVAQGLISPTAQLWCFLAFFLGFAIKVPMFPFHTWLPDAHVQAPTAGSVILAGVLLKMGTYGFLRFGLPIFPDATVKMMPFLLLLCVIGIIYGAMVAMVQTNIKKLVAYSSVSHMGFLMIGIFALNPNGLKGGIMQMLNHGLSTGALFLLVGLIYERTHTLEIKDYGGLAAKVPVYATFFMIATMSSIGLPGLNGFIGEIAILMGAMRIPASLSFGGTLPILAVSGILLGAAYMLWLYQRVFFGKFNEDREKDVTGNDMSAREWAYMLPLVIVMFWIGIYPKPFFDKMDQPVETLIKQMQRSDSYAELWGDPYDLTAPTKDELLAEAREELKKRASEDHGDGHGADTGDHGATDGEGHGEEAAHEHGTVTSEDHGASETSESGTSH